MIHWQCAFLSLEVFKFHIQKESERFLGVTRVTKCLPKMQFMSTSSHVNMLTTNSFLISCLNRSAVKCIYAMYCTILGHNVLQFSYAVCKGTLCPLCPCVTHFSLCCVIQPILFYLSHKQANTAKLLKCND